MASLGMTNFSVWRARRNTRYPLDGNAGCYMCAGGEPGRLSPHGPSIAPAEDLAIEVKAESLGSKNGDSDQSVESAVNIVLASDD
jgi:hypothetical protein